jgi:hypothetical protein
MVRRLARQSRRRCRRSTRRHAILEDPARKAQFKSRKANPTHKKHPNSMTTGNL